MGIDFACGKALVRLVTIVTVLPYRVQTPQRDRGDGQLRERLALGPFLVKRLRACIGTNRGGVS